jgi:uncharacterized protein
VLTAGASYAAHCAVVAAAARPGAVSGVLVAVPALGPGETAREPGGAVRLADRVGWWCEHGGTREPRAAFAPPDELLRGLPVSALPTAVLGSEPEGWRGLWSAPERDPALWAAVSRLGVPLLAVGGLADPFAAATLDLAAAWGGPVRLLLGPWGHDLDARSPGAALAGARIGAVYAGWARSVCDTRTGTGRRGLVAVDAAGGWRRFDPAARPATPVALAVERGTFTADPSRPFSSRRRDTGAADHAVLRTGRLPGGELRGPVEIELTARSGAPDADWYARLRTSEGRALGVAVLRRRHAPGAATTVALRTPPVAAVLRPGERLLVEVAGHHWPAHARNPHTGADPATATALRPDHRTVLAGTLRMPWAPAGTGAVPAHRIAQEMAT